jgi:excisionase family DNA binding protein
MSSNIAVKRICSHCGKEFTARTTTTLYCSHKCNSAAYKLKIRAAKIESSNSQTLATKNRDIDQVKSKEFLTVKDAALLLNSAARTIYRLIDQGDIKAINLGKRKTIIRRSDIDVLFGILQDQVSQAENGNGLTRERSREEKLSDLEQWIRTGGVSITDCYNLTEIQQKYGISEKAVHEIIIRNRIPKLKRGWFAYVPKAAIDKILG